MPNSRNLRLKKWICFITMSLLMVFSLYAQKTASIPLYIDSNYHGSCDPEIIWNENDQCWYIYYTSRRSHLENNFLKTPIGVIKSKDLISWSFEGYCQFDGVGGDKDASETFWAPAIISFKDTMHMFVTWKPDTVTTLGAWGGPGKIVHYKTSLNDPVHGWEKVTDMHSNDFDALDATVYLKGQTFHVWYKAKKIGSKKNELYHKISQDLFTWEDKGFSESDVFNKEVTGFSFEEAPYMFKWKESYWLITDPHDGLIVYKSNDAEDWDFQKVILKEGSKREMDNSMARHASVAVIKDRAFIFYHVEPWRNYEKGNPIYKQPLKNRRSVLQMAELEIIDGELICNRNKAVEIPVLIQP